MHPDPGAPSTRTISPGLRIPEFLEGEGKSDCEKDNRDLGDALVNDFSSRRYLQQFLWEDWLEHVAEDDERKGDKFCDRVCPKRQENAMKKGKKSRTCICRHVDLANADGELINARSAS